MKFSTQTVIIGALVAGCIPDPFETVDVPPTFGSELASVSVTGDTDRLTLTALDDAGTALGQISLASAGGSALAISSDYGEGERFDCIIARGAYSEPTFTWPATLTPRDLAHRAKLMNKKIGEGDECARRVALLVQLCVLEEFMVSCTERANEVACECLPEVAATCPA